jgi:transposase InsO family protein
LPEAFPFDPAPRSLSRDRDGLYGAEVRRCLRGLTIEGVVLAPRSPWQNPYGERLIGSIRRDLVDHVVVLGERHLWRLLQAYFDYSHHARCHPALDGNAPHPRAVAAPAQGEGFAVPLVGGLHQR